MKLSCRDIRNIIEGAQENNLLKWKMLPGLQYQLTRMISELGREYSLFEKKRIELLKECGAEVDDKGNLIIEDNRAKISDDNMEVFKNKLDEVLKEEIELSIKALPLERIFDIHEPVEMGKSFFLNKLFEEKNV